MKPKLIFFYLILVLLFPFIAGFSWFANDQAVEKQGNQDITEKSELEQKAPSASSSRFPKPPKLEAPNTEKKETVHSKSPGVSPPKASSQGLTDNTLNQSPLNSLQEIQNISHTLKSIEDSSDAASLKSRVPRSVQSNSSGYSKDALDVMKVQKQISEILETNERLKMQQEVQLDQIKKISEQAVIHRKMLEDIEQNRPNPDSVPVSLVDEVLKQEKLRLIKQETEKNKEYINQLTNNKRPASDNN